MKLIRCLLFAVALLGALVPAQAQAPAAVPPFRFIILVDSSYNMRRMDEITPTVVFDLIADGVHGRMQPGDVYGVWTFGEEVDTSFSAPLVWRPELARSQAQAIDQQIRRIKYSGKVRLEEAIRKVKTISDQADDLTIIIVHDGSGVMFGTPFDLPITALYRQFYKDMSKNERPFVTALAVQNKKMTAWSVTAAGGEPTIPRYPRKSEKPPAPKNPPVKAASTPKPEPAPEPPPQKPAPAPIIVKGPLKPKPAITNAPAVTVTAPPGDAPSKSGPAPLMNAAPASASAIASPGPAAAVTPSATISPPAAPDRVPATPVVPVAVVPTTLPSPAPKLALSEPAVSIAAARENPVVLPTDVPPLSDAPLPAERPSTPPVQSTSSTPSIPSPGVPPSSPGPASVTAVDSAAQLAQTAVVTPPGPDWTKLSLGILCFLGAIAAVFFLSRRRQAAAHGSVISRSMNRDR